MVVTKDHHVTFAYSLFPQCRHTGPYQGRAYALTSMPISDGQVVDEPTTSIVTAENSAHDCTVEIGHGAQSRVALQKRFDPIA